MELLEYYDLDTSRVQRQYLRARELLAERRFNELDIRKLANAKIFRAKLDDTNRLLFTFATFRGAHYLLVLEVVLNHRYDKSRFLRGKVISEGDFVPVTEQEVNYPSGVEELRFINTSTRSFHVLDKPISFDDLQDTVFQEDLPLLIVGAAGCGKTAIAIEKMRSFSGRVLFVSLSSFLVEATQRLFHSGVVVDEETDVDFLSLREFIDSIEIPAGQEVTFSFFQQWVSGQSGIKARDARKLFEEFRGVLAGAATEGEHLSLESYLALGVRESIFPHSERESVYRLFTSFTQYMRRTERFDLSMICSRYIDRIKPEYEYVVVDEVQDFTVAQLRAVLASLAKPENFLLCGDAHQIVHPNLFSWAKLKTFLYHTRQGAQIPDTIRILQANFRNSQAVTAVANRLLLLKQRRFGSVDKESNYLVTSQSEEAGLVQLVRQSETMVRDIADKISLSARYAVVVLSDDQKERARALFRTPLVFSVHEAKGLEYEHAVIFGFTEHASREYREVVGDVTAADLGAELEFSRAKDKSDKSLDIYKFYTNALYVALTRAMKSVLIVDADPSHPLFGVLGLQLATSVKLDERRSTHEEWQQEARRLELQGKTEQAEEIRRTVLKTTPVPWKVADFSDLTALIKRGFVQGAVQNREAQLAFDLARLFDVQTVLGYMPFLKRTGRRPVVVCHDFLDRFLRDLPDRISAVVEQRIRSHGVDFRSPFGDTLLISAVRLGYVELARALLALGADVNATSSIGMTPVQALIAVVWGRDYDEPLTRKQQLAFDTLHSLIVPPARRVRVGTRLIKLSHSRVEYLLVELGLFWARRSAGLRFDACLETSLKPIELVEQMHMVSAEIVPHFWRRNSYLSAVLARNEVGRRGPYNKQLFYRIKHGHYTLNPLLDLEVGQAWVPWYEAIQLKEASAALDVLLKNDTTLPETDRFAVDLLHRERERLSRELQESDDEQRVANGAA